MRKLILAIILACIFSLGFTVGVALAAESDMHRESTGYPLKMGL